jgi:hypothetical protein
MDGRLMGFEVLVILDALDALKDGWKSRGNHNDNAEDFLSPLTYKQLMVRLISRLRTMEPSLIVLKVTVRVLGSSDAM